MNKIQRIKGRLLNCLDRFYMWGSDVYVTGFPKSGNTWVRYFIAHYRNNVYGVPFDTRFPRTFSLKTPRVYSSHFGTLPGSQPSVILLPEVDHIEVFKNAIKQAKGKRVLLIDRDPRDVIVSYFFHMQRVYPELEMSTFVRENVQMVIDYKKMWIEAKDTFKEFAIVRYEDMRENDKYLGDIISFCGYKFDAGKVKESIEASSFENMKKVERGKSDSIFPTNVTNPEHRRVRKGKVGGYLDYLSKEDIEFISKL